MKRDLLTPDVDTNLRRWAHDDLAHDLAAHLRGMTDRRVWVDMQLGPVGSTRPDVYTIPCSFTRFTPLAYECKVSVSDFRADVTKGKYTDYLAYASGVIFACPSGLLRKEDIPAGAGLMTRGGDGWRTVKAPTLSKCPDLPRAFWLKLLMDGERRDHEREAHMLQAARRDLNEWRAAARIREQYGEVVAAAVQQHRDQTTGRLERLRANLELEIARTEGDLKRERDRRRAELQSADKLATEALCKLALAVGAAPDCEDVYEMRAQLDKLITLAQQDSTVKELMNIVRNISWGVKQFNEIEKALAPKDQREGA
ncbi:hypothetical protein [Paraburkholderia tagetis]|uniref:Uncharacterized protein n=1 Tax=Paraburkholderia tagetis TaxID=2913261 RepID=A0A9X1RLW2_9BURK|nr:hypothetical protein [Paraburkholderia tagetis]MCG5072252.1 hypothetical protein [Paraburkholderia tagetis]